MKKIRSKKMKKIKMFLVLLILIVSCAVFANARLAVPELVVDILRYEPTPVEPGGYFEVWISIENKGMRAQDIEIEFSPEFPFSLAPDENRVKYITAVPAVEKAVLKYRFFVDVNAPTGDELITFIVRAAGRAAVKLEKPISVRAAAAALNIESYRLTPEILKPGEKVMLDMTLKNNGKVGLKNVDVSLALEEDSKFATVTTGTKQRVALIDVNEEESVRFDLIADTSTEIKVYQLPITLEYEDFRGNEYSDSAKISLVVGAEPQLMAVIDSTEIIRMLVPGEVTFKIINNGIVDLKYLNTRILATPDYEILSPSNEAYIGNLDNDDFETVDFIIKPLKIDPLMKLVVEFKDPYNKDYTREFNLPLRIISPAELGKKKTPWGSIILGLAVIAAIVYYWFYRRRKKRLHKK